jgi:hypothetical protein
LINDRLLREAVAGKVSTRLGIPLSEFWSLIPRANKSTQYQRTAAAAEPQPPIVQPLAATQPIGALTLLALGDLEVRRWIAAQPWSARLLELEGAELLVRILDSDVSLDDPSSLAAFAPGLDQPARGLFDALLRERLPPDRMAAARDCWGAIERRDLLHRRELLKARMRDSNLSSSEVTEIQKQILDLQKLITDISRPLSPPDPE